MIIADAPLRITLFGGGTDTPSYRPKFGGYVCSAAIDHRASVIGARPLFNPLLRVKTHNTVELVEGLTALKNPEVRSALSLLGIENHVELVYMGEITGGTGLGTSSAYLVALLKLLSCFNGKELFGADLAEAAAHIEIDILEHPIGKQDHYLAALGGFILLDIARDGSVQASRVGLSRFTILSLESHLSLFYTGETHVSGKILGEQKKSAERGDQQVIDCYHRIKEIAHDGVTALLAGDVIHCGELFHQHWLAKRELPGGVSSSRFDFLCEEGLRNGAIGAKVTGAGGGGCVLFCCEPAKRKNLREVMLNYGLQEFPFKFDSRGAELDLSRAKPHELVPFSGPPRRMVHFDSDLVS